MNNEILTIVDITTENIREVLGQSTELPLVFYFFSSQIPECQTSTQLMESLANEYQGLFILAKVNCDEQMGIAQQFGLQALPTFYLFKDGQPINAIQGPQSYEELKAFLADALPSEAEQAFHAALGHIAEEQYQEALSLLRTAFKASDNKAPIFKDIVLKLAETQIILSRIDDAEETLTHLLPQDRDSLYQGLLAQIELARKAADSPEIQQLQLQVTENPNDFRAINTLALQLHQVGRNEEALSSLFEVLKKEMNCLDGEMKKSFLDILAALGTGDPLASQYRRKFYSLLY
ncbi:co-chaperone YbbN [Thorsellia kenyensis]|uniref:Co-chaperone YbbN n=1 Tax=Thorsellia kenyensis TaxID=1549888 RepID=A0ABV6C751_9GAMM